MNGSLKLLLVRATVQVSRSYFRATAPDAFLTVLRRRAPDICRHDLLFRWEAAVRRVEQAEFAPLENMWGQTDDRRMRPFFLAWRK